MSLPWLLSFLARQALLNPRRFTQALAKATASELARAIHQRTGR